MGQDEGDPVEDPFFGVVFGVDGGEEGDEVGNQEGWYEDEEEEESIGSAFQCLCYDFGRDDFRRSCFHAYINYKLPSYNITSRSVSYSIQLTFLYTLQIYYENFVIGSGRYHSALLTHLTQKQKRLHHHLLSPNCRTQRQDPSKLKGSESASRSNLSHL